MATSTIKAQECVLRKYVNYNNITIPDISLGKGYVKLDSYSSLGINTSLYMVSAMIRGWNGGDVPKIAKSTSGTDIYAIGDAGTYTFFGVEYFFLNALNTI